MMWKPRGEPSVAPLVMRNGFRIQMLRAIEFDDELVRDADEINDVGSDCGLATKLSSAQILSVKEVP